MTTYGQIEGDKSGIFFNFTNSSLSWEGNIFGQRSLAFQKNWIPEITFF
jgi:hypothetical protein